MVRRAAHPRFYATGLTLKGDRARLVVSLGEPAAARARRGERRPRPAAAVPPLARARDGGDADARGCGGRDGHRRRRAVGPHGALEALGRARLRLPHEPPRAEGARARREPEGRALAPLAGARAPGADRRRRARGAAGRGGGVLPDAPARRPDRRARLAAERSDRLARRPRRAPGGARARARREGRAAARHVGRLPRRPAKLRVLAAPRRPAARPDPLHAYARRLGDRASPAVTP